MRWISNTVSEESSRTQVEPFLKRWPTRTGSVLDANSVDQTMTSAQMSTIQSAAAMGDARVQRSNTSRGRDCRCSLPSDPAYKIKLTSGSS